MDKSNKSQVSMEYILITGFALMLTIPLVIVFFTHSTEFNDDVLITQATKVVDEIVTNSEIVYYMGEPSLKTISVYMPDNVRSINLSNGKVTMNVYKSGTVVPIFRYSNINYTGNISTYPGLHKLRITAANRSIIVEE